MHRIPNIINTSMSDQDYTAKLSDFGLAKNGPQGDDTHVTTRVMGTHGYAAPEYVMTGNNDKNCNEMSNRFDASP